MSTLASKLRIDRTPERKPVTAPFARCVTAEEKIHNTGSPALAVRYVLRASVASDMWLPENAPSGSMSRAMETTRRAIMEEVFGEYRRPLLDALRSVQNFENDDAAKLISAVLDNLFDDKPMAEGGQAS